MISSVWTERYLNDKKREQDNRSPFNVIEQDFYILKPFAAYKLKRKFTQ